MLCFSQFPKMMRIPQINNAKEISQLMIVIFKFKTNERTGLLGKLKEKKFLFRFN